VAWNGTSYLVVWADGKNGGRYDYTPPRNNDIYGARVSAQGILLDPGEQIPIATTPDHEVQPDLACGNGQCLIVWANWRRDGTGGGLFAVRVQDRRPIEEPFSLSPPAGYPSHPRVATDGFDFFVVWEDRRQGPKVIRGARVLASGEIVDRLGFVIATSAAAASEPAVAFDGSHYVVAFSLGGDFGTDLHAARVSLGGEVQDPTPILVSPAAGNQSAAAIVFDGMQTLAAWRDSRRGLADIQGAWISTRAEVKPARGVPLAAEPMQHEQAPALASDGRGHSLLVFSDVSPTVPLPRIAYRMVESGTGSAEPGDGGVAGDAAGQPAANGRKESGCAMAARSPRRGAALLLLLLPLLLARAARRRA
jgi:hypothetical protein